MFFEGLQLVRSSQDKTQIADFLVAVFTTMGSKSGLGEACPLFLLKALWLSLNGSLGTQVSGEIITGCFSLWLLHAVWMKLYSGKHMGSFDGPGLWENNFIFLHKSLKAVPVFQFCCRPKLSLLLSIGLSLLILHVLRDFCVYFSSMSRSVPVCHENNLKGLREGPTEADSLLGTHPGGGGHVGEVVICIDH